MKKLIQILTLIISLWLFTNTFAESVDHFEIEASPKSVKVGEAVDITIKAVDKNWAVVKDFDKEVLIYSNSDQKAEFPNIIEDNIYKFKTSDAWVVKFENAVKFTQKWTQDITVYDYANDNITWYAEVEVTEWTSWSEKWDINIKFPENWITLWQNKVKVSWDTQKNHNVKIVLNSDKNYETISNWEWIYELEINDLPSWENVFIAELIDADGKVIGSSKEVFFKVESSAPIFKSITLNPSNETYTPDSIIWVSVEATNWLTTISVIINDTLSNLKEEKAWTYVWQITSPKIDWEYNIDVMMKNELGIEAKKENATSINVKEVEYLAPNETEVTKDTTPVQVNCDDFKKELEVKNVSSVVLKTKSVITWDKVEKATSYNVYKKDRFWTWITLIENVLENKYEIVIEWDKVEYDDFTIKAVFKDDVCDVEWDNTIMTKVQTWPKEIIAILIALSMWAWVMYFRRKLA